MTEEAAITAAPGEAPRVRLLVSEGEQVAQGAPVAVLDGQPDVALTAPMGATVARVAHRAGHRLSEIVFYRNDDMGRHVHDTDAQGGPDGLRAVLRASGLWRLLRTRPFGGMPPAGQVPAAIFVAARDARPDAPNPVVALAGREDDLARGLAALLRLTAGPVLVSVGPGATLDQLPRSDRLRALRTGAESARLGFQVLDAFPAGPDRPVWDVHAEDVAAMGALLATGLIDGTRLVAVAGPAMDRRRLLRCQPGADLRALTWRHVRPGPHRLLTGGAVEGRAARWLGPRERLVTVLPGPPPPRIEHWLRAALRRAARPTPLIPTAALRHAMAGLMPAVPLLRAIAAGDEETAIRLGALSLLPEDLAMADYVTAADPPFAGRLDGLLRALAREGAA